MGSAVHKVQSVQTLRILRALYAHTLLKFIEFSKQKNLTNYLWAERTHKTK